MQQILVSFLLLIICAPFQNIGKLLSRSQRSVLKDLRSHEQFIGVEEGLELRV